MNIATVELICIAHTLIGNKFGFLLKIDLFFVQFVFGKIHAKTQAFSSQ